MSVQGSTSSNQINQIDPPLVSQENASGVKEHKPPTFQKAVNKLKRGFNNLVLSHNKRVVKRAYVKQEVEKNIKQFGGNGWAKANVRLFQKRNYKKDIATNFNTKALDLKFVSTLKGKDLKAFFKVFKGELLKPDDKTFFNNLPLETQKAFIEQNKGDIAFLSTFSNVYKEELKCVVEWKKTTGVATKNIPELFTVFKDAIVSNRDKIIENPTILASVDKASILEVASTLQTNNSVKEEDKPLMKTLLTAYATVDANIVETQLKLVDKNAIFTPNSNAQPILDGLLSANTDAPNEVSLNNKNILGGIQVMKDLARDAELELTLPSGKKINISNDISKNLEGKIDTEKALAIFNEMKKQVSVFDEKDKSAFVDFLCNFSAQGFASIHMPNMPSNKIDISGGNYKFFVDYSKQDANGSSFVEVGVHVNGRAKGQLAISDNSSNLLGVVFPTTNAKIVFTYDKGSLLECNNKASNIEVKHFEQQIGDVTIY